MGGVSLAIPLKYFLELRWKITLFENRLSLERALNLE